LLIWIADVKMRARCAARLPISPLVCFAGCVNCCSNWPSGRNSAPRDVRSAEPDTKAGDAQERLSSAGVRYGLKVFLVVIGHFWIQVCEFR
jgi:hypothetical protein